jgi:transcriptional antiterminator RfaH
MSASVNSEKIAWYVVQTKPRQEFRALEQLRNQGYECFLPTLQAEKIRNGKLETSHEPLFTRYLFIQLSSATSNWGPIRSTRGVTHLVAFGGRFASMPDACVEALQSGRPNVQRRLFEPGERVSITYGPFAGLEGIYQLPDGEARALVLIDLMSQPQKLKFAVDMLRKVA